MAHTKAKGTSKLGRDSRAKRLGVKIFGGQKIEAGQIIIRQRGSKFFTGEGTAMAGDDTLYAKVDGVVEFRKSRIQSFTGTRKNKTIVSVKAIEAKPEKATSKTEKVQEQVVSETASVN